jgi:uncharacterized protein YegP (UPF0339 family)
MKVFISYSDPPKEPGPERFVEKFANLLRTRLAEKLADKSIEVVVDIKILNIGDNWKGKLHHELSTCDAFVPLYSRLFFSSQWTGRELAFFRARIKESTAGLTLPIFPVIWDELEEKTVEGFSTPPRSGDALLDSIQYRPKNDQMAEGHSMAEISKKGLLRYIKHEANPDFAPALDDYISALAGQIEVALKGSPALGSVVADLETFKSPFQIQKNPPLAMSIGSDPMSIVGAQRAYFLVLTAKPDEIGTLPPHQSKVIPDVQAYLDLGGKDWKPFWPQEVFIGTYMTESLRASNLRIDVQTESYTDLASAKERIASAKKRGQPVFLVLDAWSATIDKYAALIQEINATGFFLTPVIVPIPDGSHQAELIKNIRTLLQDRELSQDDLVRTVVVSNESQLRDRIICLYEDISGRIRKLITGQAGGESSQPFTSGPRPIVSVNT